MQGVRSVASINLNAEEYEMAINGNHKAWAVDFALCNVFSRFDKQHIMMGY